MSTMDTMTRAYLTCALWSTCDDSDESGGVPLDESYGIKDIHPDSVAEAAKDCADFRALCGSDLDTISDKMAGNDFWLTRNGHGAGFWDRGLGDLGDRLTKHAETFGGVDPYVGDDGMVHLS